MRRLFTAEAPNPTLSTVVKAAVALGYELELVPAPKKPREARQSCLVDLRLQRCRRGARGSILAAKPRLRRDASPNGFVGIKQGARAVPEAARAWTGAGGGTVRRAHVIALAKR